MYLDQFIWEQRGRFQSQNRYLLNESVKENNANSRKPATQTKVVSFIIIIPNAIRIEGKLEREERKKANNISLKHSESKHLFSEHIYVPVQGIQLPGCANHKANPTGDQTQVIGHTPSSFLKFHL